MIDQDRFTPGGSKVTIPGTGFLPGATVKFSATGSPLPATFQSPFMLTVTAPAHAAGEVYVFVRTPGGASTATNYNLFTYDAPSSG